MSKYIFDLAKPLIVLFIVVMIIAVAGKDWLAQYNIDWRVVAAGNFLLFDLAMVGLVIMSSTVKSASQHTFVRGLTANFVIKFFVIAIAAFVYFYIAQKAVNREGLLVCAVLYILYTFLEKRMQTNLLKDKKDA